MRPYSDSLEDDTSLLSEQEKKSSSPPRDAIGSPIAYTESRKGRKSGTHRIHFCCIVSGIVAALVTLGLVVNLNVCWSAHDEYSLLSLIGPPRQSSPVPLIHAHSHNDYEQEKPLDFALEAGFCSIEADVFEVNGELMLGHVAPGNLSLRTTYLEPLKKRIDENDGLVYKRSRNLGICTQVILLVDLKTSIPTYFWDILETTLREVFGENGVQNYVQCGGTASYDSNTALAPLRVVVSGIGASGAADFAHHVVTTSRGYCSYLDGRDSTVLNDEIRQIQSQTSASFGSIGSGLTVDKDRTRAITSAAHERGEVVRIWATPNDVTVWRDMLDAGVDIISTDQISLLRNFLLF